MEVTVVAEGAPHIAIVTLTVAEDVTLHQFRASLEQQSISKFRYHVGGWSLVR